MTVSYSRLEPQEYGWKIDIADGQREYLANMTGPSHGSGNPLYVQGNAANTGPNQGDVNEPQEMRAFFFSPRWPRCEQAEGLDQDGRGTFEITDLQLGNLAPGQKTI